MEDFPHKDSNFDYHFTLVAAAPTPIEPSKTGVDKKEFIANLFKKNPRVFVTFDNDYLWVGSDGLPDHPMMIGITNWQQQVPIPQPYRGTNLWRIPLKSTVAKSPSYLKGHFLRGAIAVAVNGVPIFNPQNNRGEISKDIGELDQWGGHCGRADDYHYHVIPLHLQSVVGPNLPVAFALDGYPVYGETEPDGSKLQKLDTCGGHDDPKFGYHYHGLTKSPYTFTGFHGVVTEKDGQVDPQPRATSFRPATSPLPGATITDFTILGANHYKLSYTLNGEKRFISYSITESEAKFEYNNGKAGITSETYSPRENGGAGKSDNRPDHKNPPR